MTEKRLVYLSLRLHETGIAEGVAQGNDRLRVIYIPQVSQMTSRANKPRLRAFPGLIDSKVEVRKLKVCSNQVCFRLVGPTEYRSVEVCFAEVCFGEVRVNKDRSAEVGTVQDRSLDPSGASGEVCAGELCSVEVGERESRLGEVCLAEVRVVKVRSGEVRSTEVCLFPFASVCQHPLFMFEKNTVELCPRPHDTTAVLPRPRRLAACMER